MARYPMIQQTSGGAAFLRIALWILLGLACDPGMGSFADAQTLQGGVQQNESPPPAEEIAPPAAPAPDLQKYLLPGGRFIDQCAYWHDHPDAYTLMYGWPDHFPPGQIGRTQSYNGQPAPYGRCAVDPCAPYGYICWRNPAATGAPPSPTAAAYNLLRQKGCTVGAGGRITCPAPHPGPPSDARTPGGYDPCSNPAAPPSCAGQQPLTASARTSNCRLMPNGSIDCDTGGGSADSQGNVPNQSGYTTEGTGTQPKDGGDAGVPYTPLPKNGARLQGKTDMETTAGGPLTGDAAQAKTNNPELKGTTYWSGHELTIIIGEGWQENHEAKGKIPPHKNKKGRFVADYFGEAEGTVGMRKDSHDNVIKNSLGTPQYYFNLRHLTVRSTGEELIDPNNPVQIDMQSVFKGY